MKQRGWAIDGGSRAKRTGWRTPPNEISWGFMKLLREGNKTKRVYDVNPYVEVYRFYDNLYGLYNQSCDGGADVWMWLIIGPNKAMLIDTAFGLGDMKRLVDAITGGMPLIVANTSAGTEHVLGNCRFESVFCHEYDYEAVKSTCRPGGWDYLFDRNGKNAWLQFGRKDLPAYKDYELTAVRNGSFFDLGGDYQVELIWTGGSTPGHSMFLDRKRRYLFAGDGVSSDAIGCGTGFTPGRPYGQYSNVTAYRDCLTKLVGRTGEFDYLFPGHFMVNLENNVLVDILNTLDAIIAAPDKYNYKVEETSADGSKRAVRHKYIKGFGTIAYTEGGIHPPKG
jgi:glyoxylase-like metal-dependent hydrolase (beta-lactamase superfamily II)